MKRTSHVLLMGSMLALAGCVVPPPNANMSPYPPIPPPQAETVPKPPVSEQPLTWQPGHWDWNGGGYVWAPGQWVSRAGHGAMWQDGYWSFNNGSWVWVPAHWV